MSGHALRFAWYRFRATFAARRGGYLALVLLIGLVGGLALGAIAAARRTQSSFATYLASTNPSDLGVGTAVLNPAAGLDTGYNPGLVRTIAHLPHVERVSTSVGIDVLPVAPNGAPVNDAYFPATAGNGLGSVDGIGLTTDRLSVTEGRLPNAARADEIAMLAGPAAALHLHVGDRVLLGLYTNAQTLSPQFGTAAVAPYRTVNARFVGLVVDSHTILADDIDSQVSEVAYFTPALTRQLLGCCVNYAETAVKVAGGARNDAAVQNEIAGVIPAGTPLVISNSRADTLAKAQRSLRPESIALTVFGGIAALAGLLIAGQIIGRALRLGSNEAATLRALGSSPVMTAADALIGLMAAIIAGALLAAIVAVALSPLAPLGPVRAVYPSLGVSFDWFVLGTGVAALIVVLSAVAVGLALRWDPGRAARRREAQPERDSLVAQAAAVSGLPVPAVTGIRFALAPRAGRETVPVRSALLGTTLAVLVLMGTITFGASLDSLVSTPRLFGWNWDEALASGGGDIPGQQAATLLGHDGSVAAWSGYYFGLLRIDGRLVPVLGGRPGTSVQPPVLTGHGLLRPDEVVLGAVTLAQLHTHIGDSVVVSSGTGPTTALRVVGTATMPTLGNGGLEHLEMGTGALLDDHLIPGSQLNLFSNPAAGPSTIFMNLRPGADRRTAVRSLQQIAARLSNNFNFGVFIAPVAHPAEIVNYRSLGTTPAILGGALAAGAVAGLALTLVASVRRRRRELALLKTVGLTRRQLAATVAWQSSVAVVVGVVVGVPLGIVLGRVLWDLFANEIHAVPAPVVPAVWTAVVAVGAFVAGNLVAAIPGRIAARTPTAVLLRAE